MTRISFDWSCGGVGRAAAGRCLLAALGLRASAYGLPSITALTVQAVNGHGAGSVRTMVLALR